MVIDPGTMAAGAGVALAKGAAATAGRELSAEARAQAQSFLEKFRHGDIAGINDPATVVVVKEARKTREYTLFYKYARPAHRALIAAGIALRRIEKDQAAVHSLREDLLGSDGPRGLHLAEATQHGILLVIHDFLVRDGIGEKAFSDRCRALLENIDAFVTFVRWESRPDLEMTVILTKIKMNWPFVYVIAGSGKAMDLAAEVAQGVARGLPEYRPTRTPGDQKLSFVFEPVA